MLIAHTVSQEPLKQEYVFTISGDHITELLTFGSPTVSVGIGPSEYHKSKTLQT